jgi:hypothetical protein
MLRRSQVIAACAPNRPFGAVIKVTVGGGSQLDHVSRDSSQSAPKIHASAGIAWSDRRKQVDYIEAECISQALDVVDK